MNFQQLEYIIALEKHKHFADAARECGVTQPTISMMIQKLEQELGVEIFNRNSAPLSTTAIGALIINQARVILYNTKHLKEIADSTKESLYGELNMAIIPTVAPYLIPSLFSRFKTNLPSLRCRISEMRTAVIVEKIKSAEIDLAILVTPLEESQILEVPLYYERFLAYISPDSELYKNENIDPKELETDKMWLLEEGHCFRNQILNICRQSGGSMQKYEAGSIETLIKVVDNNGGYTIFPELHYPFLSDEQKMCVRPFLGEEPRREVSIVFRQDFIKEKLLNVIASSIKSIIPQSMIDNRLSKFRIKL